MEKTKVPLKVYFHYLQGPVTDIPIKRYMTIEEVHNRIARELKLCAGYRTLIYCDKELELNSTVESNGIENEADIDIIFDSEPSEQRKITRKKRYNDSH